MLIGKAELTKRTNQIQSVAHSLLKSRGFKKKGRTYNRITTGALTHVINFQAGQGVFQNKFAVNLGVLLPIVYEVLFQECLYGFVKESSCTIRERLSTLAFGSDIWFAVTDEVTVLSSQIADLLSRFGLPFLNQFNDYGDVLRYYEQHGTLPFLGSDNSSVLLCALIAHKLGDHVLSRDLLAKANIAAYPGAKHFETFAERVVRIVNGEAKEE